MEEKEGKIGPVMDPVPVPQQGIDMIGCAAWVVENGTFALGMALMFSKTVDLMIAFAPGTIFGFSGLEVFYGVGVGVLIEGALFVMKLTLPRAKNTVDWLWNVVVVVAPFLISALAQIFDSLQVKNSIIDQPAWVQVFVTWFVPSIPSVIMALLIGKSIFSSIPQEIMPNKGAIGFTPGGVIPDYISTHTFPSPLNKPAGFVGRYVLKVPKFLSGKHRNMIKMPVPATHAPAVCPTCHSILPFIEYGTKMGKDSKMAKWPIYEKCQNPNCSIGRKSLGLPRDIPMDGG